MGSRTAGKLPIPLALALVLVSLAVVPPVASAQAVPEAAELEGTLDVVYEDSERGSRLLHFLETGGRRLPLRFQGNPPDLPAGSRIRVRGNAADGGVTVADTTTIAVSSSRTMGQQDVLVILFNFSNDSRQPYTPSSTGAVNTQVENFYLENSYGQTRMTFAVTGWHTIAATNQTCDYYTWATQAEAAATAAGYDVASYDRRLLAFPQAAACGWWGMGNLSGPRAWVNGSYAVRVVAHELGHNFGNHHSMAKRCDSSTCTEVEYGDDRDVMGVSGTVGHTNAFQKERLGWLDYGSSPPIRTVTASGSYVLEPMSTAPGGLPKGLRIWNPTNSTYYYVETRARVGFDGNIAQGVVLHSGSPTVTRSSYQLDMSPTTTTWDSTLDPGQTFSDPAVGLYITTLSADANGAAVQVDFGALACTTAASRLSATASTTSPVAAGTPVTYTLSITNTDSAACPSSIYSLEASVPAGWAAAVSSPSITVLPGATVSATVNVTSPTTTPTGTYALQMRARDVLVAAHDAAASATYSVASSDVPPAPPTGLASSVSGSRATLSWRPPSSGGVVSTYLLYVGTRSGGSDVANGLNVGSVLSVSGELPRGTYYARVRAANTAGTSLSSSEIRFNVGGRLRTPGGFTVTWSGTTATLSWTEAAADGSDELPTGYVLEAGSTPGASDVASLNVGNTTTYRVEITSGTYYVRVRAQNALGESDPSEEIEVRAPGTPQAPTALADYGGGATVDLRWTASTGGYAVAGYVVEAGSSPGLADLARITVGNVTRLTTTAPPGVYYVRVRGVNARGTSLPSNEIIVRR